MNIFQGALPRFCICLLALAPGAARAIEVRLNW